MTTVLVSLFFLLFLTALVSWFVLYLQFRNSAEKRWATQVLNLFYDAEKCIRLEDRQLRELKSERDAKACSLHEEAFAAHLGAYSVDELEAYPGIGSGIIGKLRAAGFANLATLQRAHISIAGLGEKRLADINYAIRNLVDKAQSTFDSGDCRQAQTLTNQLKTLSTRYDRLEVQARTRARAAEKFIKRLEKMVECARAVTFRRWFRPISNETLIPPEVMDTSLPDLEAALQAAEQCIARNKTAKCLQTPANAVPAMPISSPRQAGPHAQTSKTAPAIIPRAEPEMPEETHLVLMELTIQFALGVARTDGPVTSAERELILQHLRQRFSYNRVLLNRAEAFLAQYETAAIDWERCLGEIKRRFTASHRMALMEFAGQIIAVSGKEAAPTASFLHRLARHLGVAPPELPQREPPVPSIVPPKPLASPPSAVKPAVPQRTASVRVAAAAPQPSSTAPAAPPPPPLVTSYPSVRPVTPSPKPAASVRDECLNLLEIPAGTSLSADLVRRQWNLLSERLAPEKIASLGQEFAKLAQSKRAALRRAAESLLEAMGEKLETKLPTPPAQDLRHNPDLDDAFGGA